MAIFIQSNPTSIKKDFAIVRLRISNNYLKLRLNNGYIDNIINLNKENDFYNSNNDNKFLSFFNKLEPYMIDQGIVQSDNKNYIYAVSTLVPYDTNDCIFLSSYSDEIINRLSLQRKYDLGLILLSLFLPCTLIFLYTGYFSNRIKRLKETVKKASVGDYEVIAEYRGKDELAEIYTDILILIENADCKMKLDK